MQHYIIICYHIQAVTLMMMCVCVCVCEKSEMKLSPKYKMPLMSRRLAVKAEAGTAAITNLNSLDGDLIFRFNGGIGII